MLGQDEKAPRQRDDESMLESDVDSTHASASSAKSLTGDPDSQSFAQALRSARPNWHLPSASLSGTILAGGRIRVGQRIGSGAMGTVYEAEHEGLPVAIKVLNRVQEHDVYRLKTEFRTLRELHHPNVVSVYELFRESDTWFFTMERIDGMPIHRYLEAKRFQSVEEDDTEQQLTELQAAFFQLVQGTVAIHAAGLAHRDLKPTNVLVAKDGRVVILDFGLVSEQLPGGIGQTIDNRVSGTFGYMSPEQARGAPATAASDCYALGAILRQLLTGQNASVSAPAWGQRPRDELQLPEPFRQAWEPLRALCDQLASVNPLNRPTASELLTLCNDWGANRPRPATSLALRETAPHFVGRHTELGLLREAHRNAYIDGPPVALIHGPCGIGKSLLVRNLIDEFIDEGTLVLEGKCSEWESVPYRGLDGIMDRMSRLLLRASVEEVTYFIPRHVAAVLRLFPTLRRVPALLDAAKNAAPESEEPFALRRRAIAGLKDLFYRLAERRRVTIVIEDLQWADTDTLQILGDLLSPPDNPTLFLLLTARAEDELLEELSASITRVTRAKTIAIGPLTDEASRHLAVKLLPASLAEAHVLDRIVLEARGIPEYIAAFAHELAIAPKDRELRQLSDALMARIDRLPASPRQLLELIATAVRPITLSIANGCGLFEIQESVRDLMTQHLVRSVALAGGERGFDTYNEHIRKVAIHAIPDERVISYHNMLVRALEALTSVEPEWLLAHYRGAGSYARAKEYSIIIAEKALDLLAYDHAATMFLVALELTSEHSPDWAALNIRCAESLTKAGRGTEAAAAFVRAARGLPHDEQLPLHSLAVEQWIRSGHVEQGVGLLRQTLTAVGIEWPESAATALLQLVARRISIRLRGLSCEPRLEADTPVDLLRKLDALRPAQTVLGTYDYLRGAAFSALALPLALKAREPKRLLVALASEAIFAAMLDGAKGTARVQEVLDRLGRLAPYAESPIEYARPALVRAVTAYWMGNWSQVRELARQAELILQERVEGTLWEASLSRSVRHTVLLHDGRFDELANDLPDALSQAAMYDDRYTHLDLQRRVATLHLLRDEVPQAQKVVSEICESREKHGILAMDHLIMSLVVAVHLYNGDVMQARAELDRRWAACTKLGMHRFPMVRLTVIGMQGDCVTADVQMTDAERARALRQLSRAARREPMAWSSGLHATLEAEALACEHSPSKAAAGFLRASTEYAECGLGICSALARQRATQLQGVSASPPSPHLQLSAIRNPERWFRIAHTLY